MEYDICILGLGYIGLPTASIFAIKGKKVWGVDVRSDVVSTINQGRIHFEEPDLDVLVRSAVQSGNLSAGTEPVEANTFILAVPTPFKKTENNPKAPDLSFVEAASRKIAKVVRSGSLVILESTSPVGTTEKMKEWIQDERERQGLNEVNGEVFYAHCPERVLPGQMMKELVSNDRLAGGLTRQAAEKAKELYQTFCSGQIFITDARTAEMVKLTENSSRDVNIAFANELSMICDHLKLDVWEVIELANHHPRVKILQPGPGVGGHCIAVDPWFIVDSAPEQAKLIKTARQVNDAKPGHVLNNILDQSSRFKKPVIACLGLAFKADIDDLRESPAMEIVEHLAQNDDTTIVIVEPNIENLPTRLKEKKNLKLMSLEQGIATADIVVVLVNHKQFLKVDKRLLKEKIIIDTRGIWK